MTPTVYFTLGFVTLLVGAVLLGIRRSHSMAKKPEGGEVTDDFGTHVLSLAVLTLASMVFWPAVWLIVFVIGLSEASQRAFDRVRTRRALREADKRLIKDGRYR